jgi:hypothetical protein
MAYRKDWGQPQAGHQGFFRTVKTIGKRVTITLADNVSGGVVGVFTVPAGFVVTGILMIATAMGTGMVINVGDSVINRYVAASAVGAAGGTVNTLPVTGLLYKNLVETEIQIGIGTAGSPAVAGTIDLYLTGFIDGP